MALAVDGDQLVHIGVFGEQMFACLEAVLQRGSNQRLLVEPLFWRPGRSVQIAVHQELGKAEEAQRHGIGQHLPAGLGRSHGGDRGQIGAGVEVVAGIEFGQLEAKVGLELGRQRQVLRRIFLQPGQGEALGRAFALQCHGQQNQRCKTRLVGGIAVEPLQLTQRQKQDVDALFLDKGAGIGIHVQQPALQLLAGQARLQFQVTMALGHTARIELFVDAFFGLGQGEGSLCL